MFYLYIAASQSAVSSALIRKESDVEHAVFYAGKGFTPAESKYPDVEKLALALIITARKLIHYFQAHSITLYINHPLRQIMQKPEISRRLVKWAIELGEFDIHYRPRVAIKDIKQALIGGLQLARGIGVERVEVFSDLQLVVNQVNGSFEAKEPQLHSYQALSKAFMQRFKSASLSHIPRKANRHEDALARLATGGPGKGRKKAKIEVLGQPSVSKTISEIFMVEMGPGEPTWMDPIIEFMKAGVCPEDRWQARKLQSRCARYTLMKGKLYRRGYNLPNLKCVTKEGEVIMGEIHEGVCGNHFGSRSLAHKALRTGFF
ncbi:PREDICTED: uncharacterized protein LOC101300577 [Fragaria vesca subsp. vesca]